MRFISMRPGQFMTNVLHCLDPEQTGKRCPSRVRLALISGHALGGMACQFRARTDMALHSMRLSPKSAKRTGTYLPFPHPTHQ